MMTNKSIDLFITYAHEDEQLLNKLKTHLRPLQRQGLITVWHDRAISAGTEWEREIGERLNRAQIILLLVSPDFIDSDYCYGSEMKRALEHHEGGDARVIPIILRPVDLQGTPFAQLLLLPKDGLPITKWRSRDEAFVTVIECIRETIGQWNQPHVLLTPEEKQEQTRAIEQPTRQPLELEH